MNERAQTKGPLPSAGRGGALIYKNPSHLELRLAGYKHRFEEVDVREKIALLESGALPGVLVEDFQMQLRPLHAIPDLAVIVLKNPMAADINSQDRYVARVAPQFRSRAGKHHRAILTPSGDLYVVDAFFTTHSELHAAMQAKGIRVAPREDELRFDARKKLIMHVPKFLSVIGGKARAAYNKILKDQVLPYKVRLKRAFPVQTATLKIYGEHIALPL